MGNPDRERSGIQTAAELARAARAVYNVIRAAAAAGLKGAAVAAVRETIPFLVKLLIGLVVAFLLLPMLIFTAMPNIFFGYGTSDTVPVAEMTQQAMTIGGAYMNLEDFENTRIDSIVTSLTAEYESNGTEIDRIEVTSDWDEKDLLWLIAINSVVYQQDLDAMSAEAVWEFCSTNLSLSPTLGFTSDGRDGVLTTLHIRVEKLEPYALMDKLGFDREARTWAGALYETLDESNALERYAGQFEAYRPDYSGDNSYTGDVQHGGDHSNEIDISGFVRPTTKNNLDLAAYAVQAWENNWGYVWGTYGSVLTESLFAYKLSQYPDGVGKYEDFIRDNWLGRRTADCIGLIKGYGWLDTGDMTFGYAENGVPDYGADQMYQYAKSRGAAGVDYGGMETLPEIPGLMLWKRGHAGVYIGDGYVIEAMGTKYGIVKTSAAGRGWTGWCKLPFLEYLEE